MDSQGSLQRPRLVSGDVLGTSANNMHNRAEGIVLESAARGAAVADAMCAALVAELTQMPPRSLTHARALFASNSVENISSLIYYHYSLLQIFGKCYYSTFYIQKSLL